MYYNYVIKSRKIGKLYTGFTADLKNRIKEHNSGKVNATKKGIPWELIYYEACKDKMDAIEREKQLKTGFGRAYLKRRLKNDKR